MMNILIKCLASASYRTGRALFLMATFLSVSGCTAAPQPTYLEGKVIDFETKQPIPGAYVYVAWKGSAALGFSDTRTVCLDLQVSVTDEQGRYRVPAWQDRDGKVQGISRDIGVYKAGYVVHSYGHEQHGQPGVETIYVALFRGTSEERMKSIRSPMLVCGNDRLLKSLEPVYRAILREVEALSDGSPLSLAAVNRWRYEKDLVTYGWTEANRRRVEREK